MAFLVFEENDFLWVFSDYATSLMLMRHDYLFSWSIMFSHYSPPLDMQYYFTIIQYAPLTILSYFFVFLFQNDFIIAIIYSIYGPELIS